MRLIDADALTNKLQGHKDFFMDAYGGDFSIMNSKEKARIDEITNCLFEIHNAPTIEAKPVVRAHWKKRNNTMTCSGCGFVYYSNGKAFGSCPECGAQMDEIKE